MNTRLENRAPVILEVPLDLLARPDLAIFLGTRLKNPHNPSTAHHEDSGEDSETRILTKDEICGVSNLDGIRESLTRPPVAKASTHTRINVPHLTTGIGPVVESAPPGSVRREGTRGRASPPIRDMTAISVADSRMFPGHSAPNTELATQLRKNDGSEMAARVTMAQGFQGTGTWISDRGGFLGVSQVSVRDRQRFLVLYGFLAIMGGARVFRV